MREFLDDNAPLWERLGYASEADYHEAQARRAREAKEQRAREAARKHAAAGRDYDVIKRMKQRKYNREYARRWRANNIEKYRRYHREYNRRKYPERRIMILAQRKTYYIANRQWIRLRERQRRYEHHAEEQAKDRARYDRNRRSMFWRVKTNEQHRVNHAKNRVNRNVKRRNQYAIKTQDDAFMARKRERDRANAAIYRARRRAEKLAAQQQDEQQAS